MLLKMIAGLSATGSLLLSSFVLIGSTQAANNPELRTTTPAITCPAAKLAQAENTEKFDSERIVGRVYQVSGGKSGGDVSVELDDGSTRTFYLTGAEKGRMGSMIGRRVIYTPFFCNRINLDTTLKYTPATAIVVPELSSGPSTPAVPPITPRPVIEQPETPAPTPTPTPEPTREIIPQTW